MQVVALDASEGPLALEFGRILRARGLTVESRRISSPSATSSAVIAHVLEQAPTAAETAALAEHIALHAANGRPPLLFLPPAHRKRGKVDEFSGCMALLRAHGAVVTSDPEVWIESLVLLAAYGAPKGARVAIVAPPGSWLAAATAAQARRAEHLGERFTAITTPSSNPTSATDAVLADASLAESADRDLRVLIVPIAGHAHIRADRPVLVGLQNTLVAVEMCGQATQRIAAGVGSAASPGDIADLDQGRFRNQLDKLSDQVGDHECKVLLSSYGIPITRQAVATTPSAATRIAKKAGYPVEIKAWGANQPSEREGAIVVRDVDTAAEVRRAFAAVCAKTKCDAVIVRETPMIGREVQVSIREHSALGLVAFVYQEGRQEAAAGMAPLRPLDAKILARQVVASRSSDTDPDWAALADLLVAATHLVADNGRVRGLELTRVIVGSAGEGIVVVDANATLQSRPTSR